MRPLSEVEALRARVAELEDEIAAWRAYGAADPEELKTALALEAAARLWLRKRLSHQGSHHGRGASAAKILAALVEDGGSVVSREQLLRATQPPGSDPEHWPEPKIVDVYLTHIRTALRRGGLSIPINLHGRGWILPLGVAERLRGEWRVAELPCGSAS